jgi:NAD(P)-dependent dehydrogenase (short-subunit alcohol dehydrogenase family)
MAREFSGRAAAVTAGLALSAGGAWWAYRQQRRAQLSFADQVVAITGGARGLGLELARRWVGEGAKVAICARSADDLQRALAELSAGGHDVLALPCDISQRDQAESFVQTIERRWGKIDVLVNNAGIIQVGPLSCMTFRDFDQAMATHFWGPLYLIRAVFPNMRAAGRGKIVNIASIGGEISVPHLLPYCASKFALVGLSEGMQAELRSAGIQVTTVCPGLMRTGSPRNADFKGDHRAEYAWFSISASQPLISIDSRLAARHIVEACRWGKPYLRYSLPARLAVPLRNLVPALTGHILQLANRLLPDAELAESRSWRGYESYSRWSPSALTYLNEQAALRNNEMH